MGSREIPNDVIGPQSHNDPQSGALVNGEVTGSLKIRSGMEGCRYGPCKSVTWWVHRIVDQRGKQEIVTPSML